MDIIDAFHLKTDLQMDYSVNNLICSHDHQEIYSILSLTKHLLWIHKDFKVKPSFHALFSLCKCLHNLWKENNKSSKNVEKGSCPVHKRDVIITLQNQLYEFQLKKKLSLPEWKGRKVKSNYGPFISNVLIVENVSFMRNALLDNLEEKKMNLNRWNWIVRYQKEKKKELHLTAIWILNSSLHNIVIHLSQVLFLQFLWISVSFPFQIIFFIDTFYACFIKITT